MGVATLGGSLSESVGDLIAGNAMVDWTDDTAVTWQEISASAPSDFGGFLVKIGVNSLKNARGIIKIGLGAAGSEVEFLRLPFRSLQRAGPVSVFCPISIPAGSRVSIAAGVSKGFTRSVQIIGYPESEIGAAPFSTLDVGPFRTGVEEDYARGVTVTAAATAHTKGAWTELSQDVALNRISGDSLPHDYNHLGVMFLSDANPSSELNLVDIAVGDVGSEVIIAENLSLNEISGSGGNPSWPSILWISSSVIAAGSRISARTQSDIGGHSIELLLAGLR